MKDAGVGLKLLIRREIDRNHGVGAQRHRDGGRGWAEESGQSAAVLEIHPLLSQSIRAITYRCW